MIYILLTLADGLCKDHLKQNQRFVSLIRLISAKNIVNPQQCMKIGNRTFFRSFEISRRFMDKFLTKSILRSIYINKDHPPASESRKCYQAKKIFAKFKSLLRISLKIIKIKKREMTKLFGRWISTMMTVGISS